MTPPQTEIPPEPSPSTEAPLPPHPAEHLRHLSTQFAELWEYLLYFLSAKADAAKAAARHQALNIILLAVVGLIASAILVTAAVLLCIGLADALASLTDHPALSKIIVGFAILLISLAALLILRSSLTSKWHSETVKKYEQRRHQQSQRFGHDVAQRAAQSPQHNGHDRS